MTKKKEIISVRISDILDKYLAKRADEMGKEIGRHVSKSDVARKILNAHMYHYVLSDSGTEEFDREAAEFERMVREKLKEEEEED